METLDKKPSALRAVPMGLYPTLDSLDSVVDLAISQVPVDTANQMFSLLMVYHNTMLRIMEKDSPILSKKE